MYSVFARYRGRSIRKVDHVRASAQALSGLEGVGTVEVAGIEELRVAPENAAGVTTLALALLAAGDQAIGIGVCPQGDMEQAHLASSSVVGKGGRFDTVRTRIRTNDPRGKDYSEDIDAAFTLLHHAISHRPPEGCEATSLVRAGYSQVEAAEELRVSKQTVNRRLAAAGWQAKLTGWNLAIYLLQQADELQKLTAHFLGRKGYVTILENLDAWRSVHRRLHWYYRCQEPRAGHICRGDLTVQPVQRAQPVSQVQPLPGGSGHPTV